LFLFQLLRYFPGSLEWVSATGVPGLIVTLLLLLPFLDCSKDRHPIVRRASLPPASIF